MRSRLFIPILACLAVAVVWLGVTVWQATQFEIHPAADKTPFLLADSRPGVNDWPFELGRRDGQYPYIGLMDEIRLYDRGLSPIEIQQLYARDASLMRPRTRPIGSR